MAGQHDPRAAMSQRNRRGRARADRCIWWLAFLLGLLPLLRWLWLGATGALGFNPTEFLLRSSGTWTLVCLLVTLALTPARHLLGWQGAPRWRRMAGLFTFFYAVLHALAWSFFDHALVLRDMGADILQRPFIAVGVAVFVILLALAATSSKAAMRMLGRQWQRLHRLVYLAGGLAILHFWWHKAGKNDWLEPLLYGGVLVLLLAVRVVVKLRMRWRATHRSSLP